MSSAESPFPVDFTPGTLEVVEAQDGDVVCFVLAGEADLNTAPELPVRVHDALRSGARGVCIDLTSVSFIDSTALAAMLTCQRGIAGVGGRMTVVHNGGEVLRLFELSQVDRMLELHTSREAALAALASTDGSDGAAPSA